MAADLRSERGALITYIYAINVNFLVSLSEGRVPAVEFIAAINSGLNHSRAESIRVCSSMDTGACRRCVGRLLRGSVSQRATQEVVLIDGPIIAQGGGGG